MVISAFLFVKIFKNKRGQIQSLQTVQKSTQLLERTEVWLTILDSIKFWAYLRMRQTRKLKKPIENWR